MEINVGEIELFAERRICEAAKFFEKKAREEAARTR
jgi:hypothetical protein